MTEQPSQARGSIPRTSRDRADEVIGRALSESADLRKVLEAVAALDRLDVEDGECPFCGLTEWDDVNAPHKARCPVTLARRLLGKE